MDFKHLFPTDLTERAVSDLAAARTGQDGMFAMQDVVWILVRSLATGQQSGGVLMYPDEMAEGRRRLGRVLDIAVAGGWRGQDLLETLMARGIASERLEAIARKAGRYCDNRPDLIHALFADLFGEAEANECLAIVEGSETAPACPPDVTPKVNLRRPWAEHAKTTTGDDGEDLIFMSPEATLLIVATYGFDPAEIADSKDGGAKARQVIECVLATVATAGYSRVAGLRVMLTEGPYGLETLAAIEHMTGEIGTGAIQSGMAASGLKFRPAS